MDAVDVLLFLPIPIVKQLLERTTKDLNHRRQLLCEGEGDDEHHEHDRDSGLHVDDRETSPRKRPIRSDNKVTCLQTDDCLIQ